MTTPLPTAGELIRALKEFYPETYDLNVAVNNYCREHGSKNWYAAALGLLNSHTQEQ